MRGVTDRYDMTNRRCDDRLCLQVADVVILYDQQKV